MEPVADALCHLIADVIFREAAEGVGIVKGLPAFVPVKKPYDLNEPAVLEQIAEVAGIVTDFAFRRINHADPCLLPYLIHRSLITGHFFTRPYPLVPRPFFFLHRSLPL
jgi:hypothetical protein